MRLSALETFKLPTLRRDANSSLFIEAGSEQRTMNNRS